MIYRNIIFISIILLTLNSCEKKLNRKILEREDKFTLAIGNMDSELDYFARDGISFSLKSDIMMSKGIFYISNGNGKKIMKFNSYGDLLQKISPSRLSDSIPQDDTAWTFNEPGSISSTDNYIYIEDTLKYETALTENYIDKSYDTTEDKSDIEKHILNEKIISIFDKNGDYINYIGQEGLESTPFPFINNIYNDKENRLIVITQTTYFWSIFRFTELGDLIDKTTIDLNYLPQLENETDVITQLNNIIPDRDKDRALVELTFYKKIIDEKTDTIVSMESIESRVYYYDITEQKYISWMDIPGTNNDKDDGLLTKHYVLMDIVKGKYLFFTSQGSDGTMEFLTITNENGYVIGEYNLNIDNTNIIYSSFYTSYPEGILTALLCTEYAGGVSMWRTDKIIAEDLN